MADAELAGKNDILVLPSDRQDGYTGDLAGIASARLDCQAALDSIRSFVKIIQASPADVADRDMKYTSPAIFRSRMPHVSCCWRATS